MAKKKLTWLLILQGWTMLWVVIGHAPLGHGLSFVSSGDAQAATVADFLMKVAYSFHMPLFFMISGYLFYKTRIQKEMSYGKMVKDKLKRLGIPLLFFTSFAFLLKYIIGGGYLQRTVSLDWNAFLIGFLFPFDGPLQEMWFVSALLLYFLCRGFYKKVLGKRRFHAMFFLISCSAFFIPVGCMGGLFAFNRAVHFFVFFFFGLMIAAESWKQILNRTICIICCTAIYVFSFWMEWNFLSAFSGCLAFWGMASWVDRCISCRLFSSFRKYTYQIFLLGIFFQIGVKVLYKRLAFPDSYVLFWFLCLGAGVYLPVVLSKVCQRINNKYLNLLLGL